jgi:hypothetical protein
MYYQLSANSKFKIKNSQLPMNSTNPINPMNPTNPINPTNSTTGEHDAGL